MTLRSKLTCLEEIGITILSSFPSLFLSFFLLHKVLQNRLALGFQVWLYEKVAQGLKILKNFIKKSYLKSEKTEKLTQWTLEFQCVDVNNISLFWYNTAVYIRLLSLVNTNNTNSVSYIRITRKIHMDRCTEQTTVMWSTTCSNDLIVIDSYSNKMHISL